MSNLTFQKLVDEQEPNMFDWEYFQVSEDKLKSFSRLCKHSATSLKFTQMLNKSTNLPKGHHIINCTAQNYSNFGP